MIASRYSKVSMEESVKKLLTLIIYIRQRRKSRTSELEIALSSGSLISKYVVGFLVEFREET